MEYQLFPNSIKAIKPNNRKLTKCRIKDMERQIKDIQSIPIYDSKKGTPGRKIIGYKYIKHNKLAA